jgi:hypothetical protein
MIVAPLRIIHEQSLTPSKLWKKYSDWIDSVIYYE